MTLEDIGNLGEAISSIGLLITIIFLIIFLLAKTASGVVENSNAAATIEAVDANADRIFALSMESG